MVSFEEHSAQVMSEKVNSQMVQPGLPQGQQASGAKYQLCIYTDRGSNPSQAPWACHFPSALVFLSLQ